MAKRGAEAGKKVERGVLDSSVSGTHCILSAAAVEAVVIAGTAAVAAARRTCKNMAHVAYTSRTTCTNK